MAIVFKGTIADNTIDGGACTIDTTTALNTTGGGTGGSIAVGDFLLTVYSGFNRAAGTGALTDSTPHRSWNEILNTTSGNNRTRVNWQFANESDLIGVTLTFAATGNVADGSAAIVAVFSGVNPDSPISTVLASASNAASTNPDPPSITPSHNNCAIVIGYGSTIIDAAPGTVTNYSLSQTSAGNDTNDAQVQIGYRVLSGGSGTPENPAAWSAYSSSAWVAFSVALNSNTSITPRPGQLGLYEDGGKSTLDPARTGTRLALSNGRLTVANSDYAGGNVWESSFSTTGRSSGKWVWAVTLTGSGPNYGLGFANGSESVNRFVGETTNSIGVWRVAGDVYYNNATTGESGASFADSNTLYFAVDLDTRQFWYRVNAGNWNDNALADPATGAFGFALRLSGSIYAAVSHELTTAADASFTLDFSQTSVMPTGFRPWSAGDLVPSAAIHSTESLTPAGISAAAISAEAVSGEELVPLTPVEITVGQGNLALSTVAPTITHGTARAPAQANLTLSAVAPSVVAGAVRAPGQTDLAFSTVAPTAVQNVARTPAQADLALSGTAPTIAVSDNKSIQPAQGDLAFSTFAPSVVSGLVRMPAQGDLVFSLFAPAVVQAATLTPGQADLTLSGFAPTVTMPIVVTVPQANLTLSGAAPLVAVSIQPAQANLAFSGFAPTVTAGVVRAPAQADLALSSFAPTLTHDTARAPAQADLTLSSVAPTVRQSVMPAAADLVLSGFAPALSLTEHISITPAQGGLTLFGATPQIVINSYIFPDADISDGTWTDQDGGTDLFPAVDDGLIANDTDYIKSASTPVNDTCVLGFSDPDDILQQPFDVMYRYKKSGEGTIDLTVRLLEGTTEIASWSHNGISGTFVEATQTLTSPQFLSITDTNNLRIEFKANAP